MRSFRLGELQLVVHAQNLRSRRSDEGLDREFSRILSEMRLVKDEWELGELQAACDATTMGFEDSVADWANVLKYGERWIEGTFFRRARAMGNDIGYDSIVGGGKHATTLHWIENSGSITPGELVLLDMGVEGHNLYTADVTRTLPVDGTFTPLQRDLYSLVYAAQQAGIEAVRPGVAFREPHNAAMTVLAHGLGDLGLLPVSVEEASFFLGRVTVLSGPKSDFALWRKKLFAVLHYTAQPAAGYFGIPPGRAVELGMQITI